MNFSRLRMADQKLFDSDYLSIWELDDGSYSWCHENKAVDGNKVAVVIYQKHGDEYLFSGRFEKFQVHLPIGLCSITGSCDSSDPREDAVRELHEEAGVVCQPEDLIDLGTVHPSKSMDSTFYLYALDASDVEDWQRAVGDGSKDEAEATTRWVTFEDCLQSEDPLLHSLLLRIEFHEWTPSDLLTVD